MVVCNGLYCTRPLENYYCCACRRTCHGSCVYTYKIEHMYVDHDMHMEKKAFKGYYICTYGHIHICLV